MKKVFSVLLAVLCLTLALTTSVSAGLGYESFKEGEIIVKNTDEDGYSTSVSKVPSVDTTWPQETKDLINAENPSVAALAAVVPGFPNTSSNTVEVVGNFFEVTSYAASGAVKFIVSSDKIVAGVQVGVAHFNTSATPSPTWEFVTANASSVDTTNHTAAFTLGSGSPVCFVIYKANTPAPSGVVNTATY